MTKEDFGYLTLILFVLWPWVLLIVEGVTWFLIGVPLTAIPWNSLRVMLALMWPVFWGMFAAGFSG